jgi:hypothetical protein
MRLWGFVKKMSRKYRENIEGIEMRFVLLVRIISFRAPAIPFGQLFNEYITFYGSTPSDVGVKLHQRRP